MPFNTQDGLQLDAGVIARRLNALEAGTLPNTFFRVADGSAAAPSYSFASSTGTGMYLTAGPILTFGTAGAARVAFSAGGFGLQSGMSFGFSSGDPSSAAIDVSLNRDAANTLAQRNGTSAQTFNLYGTYTDASNYERVAISAQSIISQAGGTGLLRALSVGPTGALWQFSGSGIIPTTDGTLDVGASAARVRNIYAGGALSLGTPLAVANGGTGGTTSTGTGAVVLANSPALVTPALGTPASGVLTNATGLPLTTGVTGTLPVANGGTGGTTSTGTGAVVLATSPALTTPNIGAATGTSLTLGAGSTAVAAMYRVPTALTPAAVAANTTAEQIFAVSGVAVGDAIFVSKPTAQAGLGIVGARVSSAGNVGITFSNNTAAAITPTASETYQIAGIR